ncbi:predicted signal transduction protein [Hydrogenimonas sp.]|nr:predicted signal transduction protein [Hydrogenimonas sp.]
MSEYHLLGRQPILDEKRRIFAYDLFFRDEKRSAGDAPGRFATVSVLTNVMNRFGVKEILGSYRAFVRVEREFLFNDLILDMPKDIFVFSVLPSMRFDMAIAKRVLELRRRGFQIALNDTVLDEEIMRRVGPLLPYFSYIKIDVDRSPKERFQDLLRRVKAYEPQLIATKVESPQTAQFCEDSGFDKFQGYFFAKPEVLKQQKIDPHYRSVIKAYNLLISNAEAGEIASYLEEHSALSLQLLRYVNSAALSLAREISSIQEVILLLGRHNVAQWLMMIIYAQSVGGKQGTTPLALMAKNRMELMRGTWKLMYPDASRRELDEAHFVGALSLLDVVMHAPMEKILSEFNISDDIKAALLHRKGKFAHVYMFVESIEKCNQPAIDLFLNHYGIKREDYDRLILETTAAVNRLDEELETV